LRNWKDNKVLQVGKKSAGRTQEQHNKLLQVGQQQQNKILQAGQQQHNNIL
jgi:hypothetical protein